MYFDSLAPSGCLQYFTALLGSVKSFNFDGMIHLANQRYSICVRMEPGFCTIEWSPAVDENDNIIEHAFSVSDTQPRGERSLGGTVQWNLVNLTFLVGDTSLLTLSLFPSGPLSSHSLSPVTFHSFSLKIYFLRCCFLVQSLSTSSRSVSLFLYSLSLFHLFSFSLFECIQRFFHSLALPPSLSGIHYLTFMQTLSSFSLPSIHSLSVFQRFSPLQSIPPFHSLSHFD